MTIDEAIKIKQQYQYILQDASFPELIEADTLSIEALKCIKVLRIIPDKRLNLELSGETKD